MILDQFIKLLQDQPSSAKWKSVLFEVDEDNMYDIHEVVEDDRIVRIRLRQTVS